MKTKADAQAFFAALQRLMKRHKVSSIEATLDGRVIFYDDVGLRACSFEGLDLGTPDSSLDDCVRDPGYPGN